MAKKKVTNKVVKSSGFDLLLRSFLGVSPKLTAARYFFESLKYMDDDE
jgi:hypothetical protein